MLCQRHFTSLLLLGLLGRLLLRDEDLLFLLLLLLLEHNDDDDDDDDHDQQQTEEDDEQQQPQCWSKDKLSVKNHKTQLSFREQTAEIDFGTSALQKELRVFSVCVSNAT